MRRNRLIHKIDLDLDYIIEYYLTFTFIDHFHFLIHVMNFTMKNNKVSYHLYLE